MKLNQVLVVYKQVSFTPYGTKGGRESRLKTGHSLHLKTLEELYELLKSLEISFSTKSSEQIGAIKDVDLVITVGGDGTVLVASHFVDKQPILGIKSFGRQSVGHFCAATRETMRSYLKDIIKGRHKPIPLHRLHVIINGHSIKEPALNDVLFAHSMPASMSKYTIKIGNKSEEQKSSGIWVSSAAGSTAAIWAAGGKTLPLKSSHFEYMVREPFMPSKRYSLLKGILGPKSMVEIISRSSQGTVCIDGPVIQYPAPSGTKILVKSASKPCWIYWKK